MLLHRDFSKPADSRLNAMLGASSMLPKSYNLIMYFFPYVLKRLKNQTFIISDDVTNSVQYIMLAHVHVPENGLPWDENPQNG